MATEEPVRALRDMFGDSKPPEISRKITACVSCRKQKIKCHMRDAQPPCVRCKKRGLPCVVNRSLQMLLETETRWRHSAEKRMKKLEDAVLKLADSSLGVADAETFKQSLLEEDEDNATSPLPNNEEVAASDNPQKSWGPNPEAEGQQVNQCEVVMDLDSGPSAIPGFYISQIPLQQQTTSPCQDLVSRGVISLEDAQRYFEIYQNRLDHFPYRVLGNHSTSNLALVRQASPLLAAAVCTVGALHLASKDFEACYREFISLSAVRSYSKGCTMDDIRALCIGAFWLSDRSWTLVGTAVRMATELQLHKSLAKALQGDKVHYYRTRLYLLVYACDHHFSVAFGRPPMSRECETIKNVRKFLDCLHATEDDARLVSQVLRWSLCSNIFDTFGVEVDRPILDSQIPDLQRFSITLDSLRMEWADSFSPSAHVGNYPRKGVGLQYYFAKLYLCSHAFRGAESSTNPRRSSESTTELDELANSAVLSAVSIIKTVVNDSEIHTFLDGLPIYFDTMIAFAVVFLIKVSTNKFTVSVQPQKSDIFNLLKSLLVVLQKVTSTMHSQHLLVSICKGVNVLLQHLAPSDVANSMDQQRANQDHSVDFTSTDPENFSESLMWTSEENFNAFFMGEYDFLLNQDMGLDVGFDMSTDSRS